MALGFRHAASLRPKDRPVRRPRNRRAALNSVFTATGPPMPSGMISLTASDPWQPQSPTHTAESARAPSRPRLRHRVCGIMAALDVSCETSPRAAAATHQASRSARGGWRARRRRPPAWLPWRGAFSAEPSARHLRHGASGCHVAACAHPRLKEIHDPWPGADDACHPGHVAL
jgi:hypothetical protein